MGLESRLQEVAVAEYDVSVGAHNVRVFSELFVPTNRALDDKGVIFVPGFLAGSSWVNRELCKLYANATSSPVWLVRTTAADIIPGSPHIEARVIFQLFSHPGLLAQAESPYIERMSDITIIGYSDGAIKASELAVLMQEENTSRSYVGLVGLLHPVGIIEQSPTILTRNLATDLAATFLYSMRYPTMFPAAVNTVYGLAIQKFFNRGSNRRLTARIAEMAKPHHVFAHINVPVAVIQGRRDRVSSAAALNPDYWNQSLPSRGRHLRDKIFPKSEKVLHVVLDGGIDFHTQPYFKRQAVVKATFDGMKRS